MAQPVQMVAVFAFAALTISCRTTPRREDVCLGEKYVNVQNDTGESVDIYMVSGGNSRLVTTVGTGSTELPLPSESGGGYYRGRRQNGRWLNVGHRGGDPTSRLTIQEKCDTPRP